MFVSKLLKQTKVLLKQCFKEGFLQVEILWLQACKLFFQTQILCIFPEYICREMYLRPDCVLHIQVFMEKQKLQEISHLLGDYFHCIKELAWLEKKLHSSNTNTPLFKGGVKHFTSMRALHLSLVVVEVLSVPLSPFEQISKDDTNCPAKIPSCCWHLSALRAYEGFQEEA